MFTFTSKNRNMMKRFFITLLLSILFIACNAYTYKLNTTKNYHNQLRLNTATGKIEQIQDDGQSWIICEDINPDASKPGRYILTDTQNMWIYHVRYLH